jgi:hypothetical protein
VDDRLLLGGLGNGHLIEALFEDRFDRRVIARLDFQRAQRRGFEPLGTEAFLEPDDAGLSGIPCMGRRLIIRPPWL